jgi:tetratricopeptide (TPR) repeat protein
MKKNSLLLIVLFTALYLSACAGSAEINSEAIEKHNQAMAAYRSGDIEVAKEGFEEVISAAPDFAESYLGIGMVYTEEGLYQEAVDYFCRAIELAPDLTTAYAERGWALAQLGDYAGAMTDYNKAIELGDNSVEIYTNQGTASYQMGQFTEAKESLEKALALEGTFFPAQYALLQVLYADEDYGEAQELADTIISQNRGTLNVYLIRGDSLLASGEVSGAVEDFSTAVDLEPTSVPAMFRYASGLYALDRVEEALQAYDTLESLDPGNPSMFLGRAACLEKLERWQDALDDYLALFEQDPSSADASAGAGRMYSRLNENDLAQQYLLLSLELNPQASTYHSLGLFFYGNGMYSEALEAFEEGFSLEKDNALLAANLALAAFMTEDLDRAREAAAFADALEPGLSEVLKVQGLLMYHDGDYSSAVDIFSQAVEADPLDAYSHYYLGSASFQDAQYDKAEEQLHEALNLDEDLLMAHAVLSLVYQELGLREEAVIRCRLYLKPDMDPTMMFGGGMFNVAGHAQEVCNQLLGY